MHKRVRLDWVVTPSRDTVIPTEISSEMLFHYSIPVVEETGDGREEPAHAINSAKLLLKGGEVLISKLNPRKSRVLTAQSHEVPSVCSTEFVVLRPIPGVTDGRFLQWRLSSADVTHQLDSQVRSATRSHQRVDPEAITKMWIDLPPLEEQVRIAGFLDHECGELDEALREYDRFAGLIEERDRQSIKRLVTGHDEPEPRVMQGPYWLAPTPEEWTPRKIVNNFRTGSGTTPTSTEAKYYGGDTYWLNSGECTDSVVYQTEKTVTKQALDEHSALKVYPVGSVVMAMYGATIGKLCVLGAPMTVNQACVVLHQPSNLDPWFTYWWLWAHREEIINLGQGGGQSNINQELVKQLRIPAPTLPVQREIVAKIERARHWSQETREEAALQRELLLERRQAVITAAVTRQLEVA